MKLAISLCPNDIFVFSGLINGEISSDHAISVYPLGKLNSLLKEGSFDFIKVSSLALTECPDYRVTRVGASLARHKGPQLVRKKGRTPGGSLLGVPSVEATATRLARRYFPYMEIKEFPLNQLSGLVADEAIPYALIINEDMNRLEELSLESVCDLGLRWNRECNALLPLGVVAAKNSLAKEQVEAFENDVNQSILWARSHREEALKLTREYTGDISINQNHVELFTEDAHLNPEIPRYFDRLKSTIERQIL